VVLGFDGAGKAWAMGHMLEHRVPTIGDGELSPAPSSPILQS